MTSNLMGTMTGNGKTERRLVNASRPLEQTESAVQKIPEVQARSHPFRDLNVGGGRKKKGAAEAAPW
jgi:hypothetical protein